METSEEHLQILDVLGVAGGVIALTKRDLVDDETLAIATDEVLERVEGTVLAHAPVIPVSAETGEGVDRLVAALDALLGSAPGCSSTASSRSRGRGRSRPARSPGVA
jgi:selenocysteine-specific elongation factor